MLKKIDLKASTTYSMTFDGDTPQGEPQKLEDGRTFISLGTIEVKGGEAQTLRANGGEILYATTSIENKLERIISLHIFGTHLSFEQGRDFFDNEILISSHINLNFKKELAKKIIQDRKVLKGKKKDNLEKGLSDIIKWRNMFAHGKSLHDNKRGWLIRYYSGRKREQTLDNSFWENVEKTFLFCDTILQEIIVSLEKESFNRLVENHGA